MQHARKVNQIKSPPFSTPHRSSDRQNDSAIRRDAVATNSRNTPRPQIPCDEGPASAIHPGSGKKASYGEREPLAREGDGRDERGGGEGPAMAEMGQDEANRVENRLPWVPRRKSDEPAVSTPAPLRSNLQQSKLLAAAAAIEAAAAAVAAIPTVRYQHPNHCRAAMAHRHQVLLAVFLLGRYSDQYQRTWSGLLYTGGGQWQIPAILSWYMS